MFINYENGRVTIRNFRIPQAYVTDLAGIAEALSEEREEALSCTLFGNELGMLEDGEYWKSSSVTQVALEELHDLIGEAGDLESND